MQLHPMPEFGSWALLLALMLSAYTLVAGALALWRSPAQPNGQLDAASRLGETARRAGIASFIAMCCAAFALVWAAFTNDYSVAYILHHTNRALPVAYKFSALWSGQEGSLLLWAWLLTGYGFVLRAAAQGRRPPVRLCLDHPGWRPGLLPAAAELRRACPSRCSPARSRRTASASIPCCSIRRWSSIRRCSTSATSASRCPSPSRSAR